MTAPEIVPGFIALADRYDVLLCDIWGVVHNGREPFLEACAALAKYRETTGKPVILISNSPRRPQGVIEQMGQIGVPREAWSLVVTSGEATRSLLAGRAPGPAWKLGPERDDPLYEGLGLAFTGPEEAAFIACTGPFDDETETPEDYRDRFQPLAARGATMICANPDIVVQRGPKLVYCGGALAQLYAALEGPVLMAGKPHRPIYDLALEEAGRLTGRAVDRARVLCIGDGPATDLRGANAQGLDALFVATGIHAAELMRDGALDPALTVHLLEVEGVSARYAMPGLVW